MAATYAKAAPQTRLEKLRTTKVDTSVRGSEEERIKHQLKTLEDWRPIRENICK
ncbi:MAG: hypothetical protein WB919_06045 [Candidatus Sulfotelmatobacter sp.]